MRLIHSPAGSVMSDVEEAPARVVSTLRGDRMNPRVHGMGSGFSVSRVVRILPVKVLFAGAAGVGGDHLDEVLEGRGSSP